jgi:hypothetical protein
MASDFICIYPRILRGREGGREERSRERARETDTDTDTDTQTHREGESEQERERERDGIWIIRFTQLIYTGICMIRFRHVASRE